MENMENSFLSSFRKTSLLRLSHLRRYVIFNTFKALIIQSFVFPFSRRTLDKSVLNRHPKSAVAKFSFF